MQVTSHSLSSLGEGLTSCSGPCGGAGRKLTPTVPLLGGMQRTTPRGGHSCPDTPLPSVLITVGLTCQGRHPSSRSEDQGRPQTLPPPGAVLGTEGERTVPLGL